MIYYRENLTKVLPFVRLNQSKNYLYPVQKSVDFYFSILYNNYRKLKGENTMDNRKNYYLTIDTETANGLDDPLCYDIGGVIHDKNGKVYESFSFVIYEIFVLCADIMESAYYAEKIPYYEDDLKEGTRKMVRMETARRYIENLCKKYNVKAIIAHNAPFDYRSTSKTMRYITSSEKRYFLPFGIPLWDTLKMAQDTICQQKMYKSFCAEHGYTKKNGAPRATAEILYQYISGESDFSESHTGLEDCLIEKEIFAHCMRQHKKMRKTAFNG